MNINSYASYSSSLLNPYASVSSSQAVSETQNSSSQDTLKNISSQQPSQQGAVNDFNVNISEEARQSILNTTQSMSSSSESDGVKSELGTTSTTDAQQTQQLQETRNLRQVQPEQQVQSQFYQSPYGQVPLSRSNIDLMA